MQSAIFHRLGASLAVLAVICLVGGHWALMQSVAWTGMLITYSQEDGLPRAVEMTFDGKNPCGLCTKIQEERGEEQRQPLSHTRSAKLEPALIFVGLDVEAPVGTEFEYPASFCADAIRRFEAPPVPVPIEAA